MSRTTKSDYVGHGQIRLLFHLITASLQRLSGEADDCGVGRKQRGNQGLARPSIPRKLRRDVIVVGMSMS